MLYGVCLFQARFILIFLFLQVFHLSAFWFASIGIIGVFFNSVAIGVILLNNKVYFKWYSTQKRVSVEVMDRFQHAGFESSGDRIDCWLRRSAPRVCSCHSAWMENGGESLQRFWISFDIFRYLIKYSKTVFKHNDICKQEKLSKENL